MILKKHRKKIIFLSSLIILPVFWQLRENKEVELQIGRSKKCTLLMPLKDREALEYFFKYTIAYDSYAYTLFGSKPMSMLCYYKPMAAFGYYRPEGMSAFEMVVESSCPHNLRIHKGLRVWDKYKSYFENSPVLVTVEENPRWDEPQKLNPSFSVILIHKQKFKETIDEHIDDFRSVLQREDISGDTLLQEISQKPLLKILLQNHEGLIGTLFGYGRENAWMFQEREKGRNVSLIPAWGGEVNNFFRNFNDSAWWWLGIFPKRAAEYVGYPSFAVNGDTVETQELKKEYLRTREQIIQYYEGKDFLEATLALFLEGPPT